MRNILLASAAAIAILGVPDPSAAQQPQPTLQQQLDSTVSEITTAVVGLKAVIVQGSNDNVALRNQVAALTADRDAQRKRADDAEQRLKDQAKATGEPRTSP